MLCVPKPYWPKSSGLPTQRFSISATKISGRSRRPIEILLQSAANILAQFPGGSQKVEDYIDMSLIDALRTEGFFSALERK